MSVTPAEATVVRREQYEPSPYRIESVSLEFDLKPAATEVQARLVLSANEAARPGPLVLDGEDLRLLAISLDGKELAPHEYELTDRTLSLDGLPARFELQTRVEINPAANTQLSGLYLSSGNFCTQCEAMGFRRITYFLDRPDVMARFRVTIRADETAYPVLLSNGNRVAQRALPGGRQEAIWEDPYPKPSYLFALVAGDLRCHHGSFTTRSGRHVQLEIWVEPQNIDRCEHALASLIKAMKWDEDEYGLEYDLDTYMIVAVNDFNMGAMENKGLNVFNSKYVLASPATATDDDYELIEAVIAHEYFHNWTGNRVTCRDWFQLTLKEGLTVFRDQQFTAEMTSAAVKRIEDVKKLRSRQFPEDDGPMAHPIRPESYVSMDNFYTATVYDKGAEVIRMYHTLLGRDGFRRGMKLYFQRHDGQAVTCDDFRAAMADANGVDLEQFGRWYDQAGTPELHVSSQWNESTGEYTLILRQAYPPHPYDVPGTSDRRPLHLPVVVGLLDRDGKELSLVSPSSTDAAVGPVTSHRLQLKRESETFRFTGLDSEPVPSVLRGFSAPVKLKMQRDRTTLAFLMSHDSDPFNRWDAAQRLATDVMLQLIAEIRADRTLTLDEVFAEAFGKLLAESSLDGAFKSLLVTLPGAILLAQEMEIVDPESIQRATQFLRRGLADRYREQLLELYQANCEPGPYRNVAASIQHRRLKNAALSYLASLVEPEMTGLLMTQFRAANNMTDQQAALVLLNQLDVPQRSEALASFYDQWKANPLVVDKWFSVQAVSELPSVLPEVVKLVQHPDFTLKNPNRVRALVGAFGAGNLVGFHQADGAGYEFVAEMVSQLDAINPQVAARLVAPFNQWKRFDLDRQLKMKGQLRRLQQQPNLSKDVGEIVTRALGAS